jgi:hypothetical protein
MFKAYLFYFFFFCLTYINSIKLNDNDFFEPKYRNLVRKIDRLSKNKNMDEISRIIFDTMVEKLHNYILTRDIERKEVDRSKYEDIYYRKNDTKNITEDGTYDLFTKEKVSFDRGYQVSFETDYDQLNKTEYEILAYKMSLMSDNNVYLGVYENTPELSFHFEDIELANVLGIVFDQISIWDWSISEQIYNYYRENID